MTGLFIFTSFYNQQLVVQSKNEFCAVERDDKLDIARVNDQLRASRELVLGQVLKRAVCYTTKWRAQSLISVSTSLFPTLCFQLTKYG